MEGKLLAFKIIIIIIIIFLRAVIPDRDPDREMLLFFLFLKTNK